MKARLTILIFFILAVLALPPVVFAQCTSVYENKGCMDNACCGTQEGGWIDMGCGQRVCYCEVCPCIGCDEIYTECCECSSPICGGGCFIGEVEIATERSSDQATKKIKEFELGDIVSSFNPKTGEVSEGEVTDIHKLTREGYYVMETESSKKVEVTAEHPFLVVKNESFIAELKNLLSHILTYQLITGAQTKLGEILK